MLPSPSTSSVGTSTRHSGERKPFDDLGPKQKNRRLVELAKGHTSSELSSAAALRLKTDGNADIAAILEYLFEHPDDVERVKNFVFNKDNKKGESMISTDRALGIIVSLKLSRWEYNTLKNSTNEYGINIFPSYYAIQKAKLENYPAKEAITLTDTVAQIELQALLDLTVKRLFKCLDEDFDEVTELTLVSKWGMDGASNQSNYKQTLDENEDDSSIFMASLVPIKLVKNNETVWENPCPGSPVYCRPIFFKFMKESKFAVIHETALIEGEILNLVPSQANGIKVNHSLLMTMIDGKISSILTNTSTQCCDICKALPSEMNKLDILDKKTVSTEYYCYGTSTLHAWIRFMECILHISYKLENKSTVAKGNEQATSVRERKEFITTEFRKRTGLLIDQVKQGHGTTNDGNTARKFFENYKMSAQITEVNEELIYRFSVILQAISSGLQVDTAAFKQYARETYELYISLYSWYRMPSSIHKILMHGAAIFAEFGTIPIGSLSEEASEARNKDFRRYRHDLSRKFCRKSTNEDVLHNHLLSSDPYLSSFRPKLERKHRLLTADAKQLLVADHFDKENIELSDHDG